MPKEELMTLLTLAKDTARKAGDLLKDFSSLTIKEWDKDIKITADIEAHNLIASLLSRNSDLPILSEEGQALFNYQELLCWVIDPLDGSLNFQRKLPLGAVSIALMEKGEPLLGVVYDFFRGEMFSGVVGVGAWRNDELINVSSVETQEKAVLMTGFPSGTDFSQEALSYYVQAIQSFKKIRLIGTAALSLSYVACGRADAYFERDIKIWDVAAGLALVKSAGGFISTHTKGDTNGRVVSAFASNKSLEKLLFKVENLS